MKCWKCRHGNVVGATECEKCGVVFADIRGKPDAINLFCPWNDHGAICGKRGSMSDSTNGYGTWYCSEHWMRLKGWTTVQIADSQITKKIIYRERWFAENGGDYEIAKIRDFPPFKCVGREIEKQLQREAGDEDFISDYPAL
mgnify:CR=1 FL=1